MWRSLGILNDALSNLRKYLLSSANICSALDAPNEWPALAELESLQCVFVCVCVFFLWRPAENINLYNTVSVRVCDRRMRSICRIRRSPRGNFDAGALKSQTPTAKRTRFSVKREKRHTVSFRACRGLRFDVARRCRASNNANIPTRADL